MFEGFDAVPLVVGAAVGLGEGLLGTTAYQAAHKHTFTIYRSIVIAAGLVGEVTQKTSADINYGLMTSGIALFAQRVPAAFTQGSAAFGYEAGVVAPRRLLPDGGVPGRVGHGSGGGCSSCGGGAASPYATLGHDHAASVAALSSRSGHQQSGALG
jgi:hypothetical protein